MSGERKRDERRTDGIGSRCDESAGKERSAERWKRPSNDASKARVSSSTFFGRVNHACSS